MSDTGAQEEQPLKYKVLQSIWSVSLVGRLQDWTLVGSFFKPSLFPTLSDNSGTSVNDICLCPYVFTSHLQKLCEDFQSLSLLCQTDSGCSSEPEGFNLVKQTGRVNIHHLCARVIVCGCYLSTTQAAWLNSPLMRSPESWLCNIYVVLQGSRTRRKETRRTYANERKKTNPNCVDNSAHSIQS